MAVDRMVFFLVLVRDLRCDLKASRLRAHDVKSAALATPAERCGEVAGGETKREVLLYRDVLLVPRRGPSGSIVSTTRGKDVCSGATRSGTYDVPWQGFD